MTRRENDDVFILVVILADVCGIRVNAGVSYGDARRRFPRRREIQVWILPPSYAGHQGRREFRCRVGETRRRLVRRAVRGGSRPQLQVVARCCWTFPPMFRYSVYRYARSCISEEARAHENTWPASRDAEKLRTAGTILLREPMVSIFRR